MKTVLKTLAAASLLAAAASYAYAAPANVAGAGQDVDNGVVQVHGNHRSCERGPGGWHRHNRLGERRPCREWRGQGRRPDSCVKCGPAWFCDY